jgi:hypothetical protein
MEKLQPRVVDLHLDMEDVEHPWGSPPGTSAFEEECGVSQPRRNEPRFYRYPMRRVAAIIDDSLTSTRQRCARCQPSIARAGQTDPGPSCEVLSREPLAWSRWPSHGGPFM